MKTRNNFCFVFFRLLLMLPWTYACSKDPSGGGDSVKTIPTVQTTTVKNILYTGAKVSASIQSDGHGTIVRRGICWSTHDLPCVTDSALEISGNAALYTCELSHLQINTTYHVRAFATNEVGTGYGQDVSFKTLAENVLPISVDPLLKVSWSVFTWPCNYYYPAYSGPNNINGKYPAPCGPTTLARVLAYWGGRMHGKGIINAMNTTNEVRFVLNLDSLSINYANLPATLRNTSFSEYTDVAKVFWVAGAISLTNFADVGTPGDLYIQGLKQYLNVNPDVHFARRWDYSKEDWIQLLKNELAHGRPVMIAARTAASPAPWESGSVAGHWFNIEGYNAENKFYINYNYASPGAFKGYYDVDNFGEYKSYGLAVIGFKPE